MINNNRQSPITNTQFWGLYLDNDTLKSWNDPNMQPGGKPLVYAAIYHHIVM